MTTSLMKAVHSSHGVLSPSAGVGHSLCLRDELLNSSHGVLSSLLGAGLSLWLRDGLRGVPFLHVAPRRRSG